MGGGAHQLVNQGDVCLSIHEDYLQQNLLLCSEQSPNVSHFNNPYIYLVCMYLLNEKINGD
jgi:hypothetical protein